MNDTFKTHKIKATKQRLFLYQVIMKLQDEATLKNIINNCSLVMNQSTIYRILELFVTKGIVLKSVNYNDDVYYSLQINHIHYFTCVKCHRHEAMVECPVDEITKSFEKEKGYKILNHTVLLNGICPSCLKQIK